MPFVLLFFGLVLFIAGIKGTQGTLWELVKGDFTGSNSFLVWIAAIAVIGGIGYIPKLKPFSVAFMTLLLLVLVLSNKGVFARLQSFVLNPISSPPSGTNSVPNTQPLSSSGPSTVTNPSTSR